MSQLRVLLYGNHTNLALYAWRFQFAKSVDVYHVSDSGSDEITIETHSYGTETFRLKKHFRGFAELSSAVGNSEDKFDLVILSASSLQEFSSITAQLNGVIMANTKIFVESTGFVQLEPFIRMSISSGQVKVFSLMTDYDIRAVAENRFVQFNANDSGRQTIYIGETGSLKSNNGTTSYPKPITSLLTTFHSLFLKLFPDDVVDTCNFSPSDFLAQQWKLAIPKVCFDPLLVLFEEFVPEKLHQQILAKPLISGLVTEVITLTKTMGVRLPSGYDTESELLKRWVTNNGDKYPALLYHFEHRTAPLDVDLLLLQPILLADDFTIKTPYLEFLYSMMCQFKKLNDDESKLFTRSDRVSSLRQQLGQMSLLKDQMKVAEEDFARKIKEAKQGLELQLHAKQNEIMSLNTQLQKESSQVTALRQELDAMTKSRAQLLAVQARAQAPARIDTTLPNSSNSRVHTPVDSTGPTYQQEQYTDTGTPVLRDIEDIAVYGIAYGESPTTEDATLSQPQADNNDVSDNSRGDPSQSQPAVAAMVDDHVLRERELKLRRRELELQERELELQKKQSQTMLNQKYAVAQSKSGVPPGDHPSQYSNQMHGRKMHGGHAQHGVKPHGQGIPGQYIPGNVPPQQQSQPQHRSYVGPGSGIGQRPLNNVGLPQTMLESAAPIGATGYVPKQFQKTSRKNRRSNMPMLRNPSNSMLSDYSLTQPQAPGHQLASQQRFNSLTGNPPALSMHYHNGSMPRLNGMGNPNVNGNPSPMRSSSQGQLSGLPIQPQQQYQPVPNGMRQLSTSTTIEEVASTASVVQRPPTGAQFDQQYNSNSDSLSNSPPVHDSDVSSNSRLHSSEQSGSSASAQDNQPASAEPPAKPEEVKKSKFSFFHSKKK